AGLRYGGMQMAALPIAHDASFNSTYRLQFSDKPPCPGHYACGAVVVEPNGTQHNWTGPGPHALLLTKPGTYAITATGEFDPPPPDCCELVSTTDLDGSIRRELRSRPALLVDSCDITIDVAPPP
ncbi:MAG TPA: hypothetical protein VFB36_13840, partial [Nevskiaceae bacterium]|nr:hypothetical protein [Nevskiaceae bacterium]